MKWLLVLALSGCTALGSPAATVGCQAVDAATTVYALHHGAVEANPVMAHVLSSFGMPGLFLAKAAITVALLKWGGEARPAVNAVSCGVAIHNLAVL